MALDPARGGAIANLAFASYLLEMPTAVGAMRSNPAKGILPHNPVKEMIKCCGKAFASTIGAVTVKDNYAGTGGASTATPSTFTLAGKLTSPLSFATNMGWIGVGSLPVAAGFTEHIYAAAEVLVLVQMFPPPGGGAGAGVISPAVNSGLTALAPVFVANLVKEFTATGKFTKEDLGVTLTPEILRLCSILGAEYALVLATITGAVVYAGSASPTAVTLVNQGMFI